MKGRNAKLYQLLKSGKWYTLLEIQALTGYDAATSSSGLRDFRKPEFGSNIVEKKCVGNRIYKYRLIINPDNHVLEELYNKKSYAL